MADGSTIDAPALPHRVSNPAAGVIWMLLSCALLSGVAALGRYAALAGMHSFQVVFLRLVFAAIALSPLLLWHGTAILRTRHLGTYAVRIVLGLIGMGTWFTALKTVSVGDITAISFLTPLFATLGAALFLGETVGWRRWTSTLVGFAGALVILRPGTAALGLGTWLALVAALSMAAASLFIKRLSDREHPDKVVLISVLLQTPLAAVPAALVWQWPSPDLWLAFAVMGLLAMAGHICLARAFAVADASLVMGADFARLPFAVLYGFAMFGELIDLWTWVGAAVIFAASLYNGHREARRRRAVMVDASPTIEARHANAP